MSIDYQERWLIQNTSTISIQQYDSKEHLGPQRFFSVIMFCAVNDAHGFKHLFIDDSMKAGWGKTKSCMQPLIGTCMITVVSVSNC